MPPSIKVNLTPIKPDPAAVLSPRRENTLHKDKLQALEELERAQFDWQAVTSTSTFIMQQDYFMPHTPFDESLSWLDTSMNLSDEPEGFQDAFALDSTFDAFMSDSSPVLLSARLTSRPELNAVDTFLAEAEELARQGSNPIPHPSHLPQFPGEFDEFSPALPADFSSDEAAASSDEEPEMS